MRFKALTIHEIYKYNKRMSNIQANLATPNALESPQVVVEAEDDVEKIFDMIDAVENAKKIFMFEKEKKPNQYGVAMTEFHLGFIYKTYR